MKLAENIYKLDCTRGSYAYAIQHDDGVTLIDTSFSGKAAAILRELETLGIRPPDVKRILVTHGDGDHVGNIAFLAQETGCCVYVSVEDLAVLRREKPAIGLKRLIGAVMRVRLPQMIHTLSGAAIEDIQIIRTPGHTPGHVCFRYNNVLFAGDLVSSNNYAIIPAPSIFTPDKLAAFAACRALDMTGVDWICPAHGEPVRVNPAWDTFLIKYTK